MADDIADLLRIIATDGKKLDGDDRRLLLLAADSLEIQARQLADMARDAKRRPLAVLAGPISMNLFSGPLQSQNLNERLS